MFLIDCFQNICNKLGVPLSEETTEGLVKYFYAPQMYVSGHNLEATSLCAAYQRIHSSLHVYMWFAFLHATTKFPKLEWKSYKHSILFR